MSCCFGIINNNNNNNKRRQAPSGSLDCRRVRCAGYLKRAAYESQYRRHCDVAVSRSSQRHHPSSDDDADECQCHVRLAIITTGCSAGDLLGRPGGQDARVIGHPPVFVRPIILHSVDINNVVIARYDDRFVARAVSVPTAHRKFETPTGAASGYNSHCNVH